MTSTWLDPAATATSPGRHDPTNPFLLNQNIKPTGQVSDQEPAAARA
jgi:hypothetical protein